MKDYKVETKPSTWHIELKTGTYSDRREEHCFIAANSEEEVWELLCRYWQDTMEEGECTPVLHCELLEKKFMPQNIAEHVKEFMDDEDSWPDYFVWQVSITNLKVIHFAR